MINNEVTSLFKINNDVDFESHALKIFHIQSSAVSIYNKYISLLGLSSTDINDLSRVPFLPISFFKTDQIISIGKTIETVFTSSSTTNSGESKHFVHDLTLYERSFTEGFQQEFGLIDNIIILALLPSYLEREGSSLVYMVNRLIELTGDSHSGFYIHNFDALYSQLLNLKSSKKKVILIGVSYALIDFSESYNFDLGDITIIETGGMKGRKKELNKKELHAILKSNFKTEHIGGEYGMTEILSQAYSAANGIYSCPPWMKVIITDINDPFSQLKNNQWGRINVIDLANIYSCSFIATDDIGRINDNGQFEIAGRIDYSDMRGCSLLYS